MSVVFFKLNKQQEKEIQNLMYEEGYTNKAEFFRFLVKFFKFRQSPDELRVEKAVSELENVLIKLDKQGKLGKSLEEQLSDV